MKRYIIILAFLLPMTCIAQRTVRAMGSLLDDEAYENTPTKPQMLTRSYSVLPTRVSLRPFCPTPLDQGYYQTCTSWAVAYAARTIMQAELTGRKGSSAVADQAFSPTFVYSKIKDIDDDQCMYGSRITDALKLLKDVGVSKKSTFYDNCSSDIPAEAYKEAGMYKIEDFFTLFRISANAEKKIESTKMAISEGRPVIISMECYDSFCNTGKLWNGPEGVTDTMRGHHAMCAVGYDDELFGGSFLIMNSWGTEWADSGFVWLKYNDYAKYVKYGYEMKVSKAAVETEKSSFSGSMNIVLADGKRMPVLLGNKNGKNTYQVPQSYPSGTRYRIMLSNNEPAYVYVLGSDSTGHVEVLFPPEPTISPALVYKSNDIAIPDENWFIETDNTVGTDYLCLLYCSKNIDINALVGKMEATRGNGSFRQRLDSALGQQSVSDSEINFGSSKVTFNAKSDKNIVPIVLEIPHSN